MIVFPPLAVRFFVTAFHVVPPVVVHDPSLFVVAAAWNSASGGGGKTTGAVSGVLVPVTSAEPERDVA